MSKGRWLGAALVILTYYHGSVRFTSPDGSRELGRTESLVKRVVDEEAGRIEETVLQPAREAGKPAEEFSAVLTRLGSSRDFQLSDRAGTSGVIRFEGDAYSAWSYDLRVKDGRRLTGRGAIDEEGLKAVKRLASQDGSPFMAIEEDLKAIGPADYRELRERLLAGAKTR